MQVKLEWSTRVTASEPNVDLHEFASECLKSLIDAELVPESAWLESTSFDWNRHAQVTVRWDTRGEIELTEKYVPASADSSATGS